MQNGINFKVISNSEEAKSLWQTFSPNQTIDDDWGFRYTLIKDLNFKLHFIVGYDDEEPIGLLALQENPNFGISKKVLEAEKPFLEFFGGVDTDSNLIFLKPGFEYLEEEFLKQINSFAILSELAKEYSLAENKALFQIDKFQLSLENVTGFESFLNLYFSGKTKRNLIHRIRHMERSYKIEVNQGAQQDLDLLFKFSIERFGQQSSFNMPHRQQLYIDLFNNFKSDLFTISLDGVVRGIAFCIIYNKTYTLLNVGYDIEFRDIGKLLISTQIERAVKNGCTLYDAGKGDNGWKERFHLQKVPLYKLTLN